MLCELLTLPATQMLGQRCCLQVQTNLLFMARRSSRETQRTGEKILVPAELSGITMFLFLQIVQPAASSSVWGGEHRSAVTHAAPPLVVTRAQLMLRLYGTDTRDGND